MNGLYIEYNIRGEDGRIYPNVVLTSKDYGQEVFNDLTEGQKAGSVSVDKDMDGFGSKYGDVKYDRAFIVLP